MIELDSPQGEKIIAKLLSIHASRGGGNLVDTIGGVVTGGLSIGNSRTAKQVRTKLDRMGARTMTVTASESKKTGAKGLWVQMYPARIRTTSDRALMKSAYEFTYSDDRPPLDKYFKIRVIGRKEFNKNGKRNVGYGTRGLSIRIGRRTVEFPYAYIKHKRAIEWSIKKKQEFRLRAWPAKYYIDKAGGLAAVEEYAKQRLQKNTSDGIGYMIMKFLKNYQKNSS